MNKLTNPKIAHADAVIRLAGRLLNESQHLIDQVAHIGASQHLSKETKLERMKDLNKKIKFHVVVLRDIIKQEQEMIKSEIQGLKHSTELKTLKEQMKKLKDLSYLTEKQYAVTLSPKSTRTHITVFKNQFAAPSQVTQIQKQATESQVSAKHPRQK